jgi:hypothetical protein
MIKHLTLLLSQQSPLTFPVGLALGALLGGIIGVVFAGLMKYAMERKNDLILAYSQLTGKKFSMTQGYADVLRLSLYVYYNIGIQKECEKAAKLNEGLDGAKQKFYLDQRTKKEEENEYNIAKFEKKGNDLVKVQENFWKTIGIINAIASNKKVDELIEDIRKEEISIMNFQQQIINETKEGLPDYTRDGSDFSAFKWRKEQEPKLDSHIQQFTGKVDLLTDYVRKNETNKHWLEFLR